VRETERSLTLALVSVDAASHRGVDLISDALPFGRLWYDKPDDAIGYAKFRSRSHDAVIRVYDETHEHKGELKEP
jgi:hypothetical protein